MDHPAPMYSGKPDGDDNAFHAALRTREGFIKLNAPGLRAPGGDGGDSMRDVLTRRSIGEGLTLSPVLRHARKACQVAAAANARAFAVRLSRFGVPMQCAPLP
jgi:hypothetical protein